MEILKKVEQLKQELDALRPLAPAIEDRIMQKLRLDWNYHSNKLEGNTYSFGETKMLLLKGLTAGGKPVRDHEEISGHNEAISVIIEYIKQDEPLTEIFIRQLHTLILVRPFWADAKTAVGDSTKRLIKVGEYKTEPNHVETRTGEMFYFAEPIETPAKMQELVDWFRVKPVSLEANPILIAAEFHYRFVLIHPFDDGNGRLARLLMNFVLMQFGYPPVIIKNEDKDNYIAALDQANFAILDPFVDYVTVNLAHSLEIMIRGALGEDIEEPKDLDRELSLIEKRLEGSQHKISISRANDTHKSRDVLLQIVSQSFEPLASLYYEKGKKFGHFYKNANIIIEPSFRLSIQSSDLAEMINHLLAVIDNGTSKITLLYKYSHFLLEDSDRYKIGFSFTSAITYKFHDFNIYDVTAGDPSESYDARKKLQIEKEYSEYLDLVEIDRLVKFEINRHKNRIAFATEYYESLGLNNK